MSTEVPPTFYDNPDECPHDDLRQYDGGGIACDACGVGLNQLPKGFGRPRNFGIDPQIEGKILASLRNGAFRHVAVKAVGVKPDTFRGWLEKYPDLREKVERAEAECRSEIEWRVAREKPLEWLRLGPGRDKGPDEPGWSDTTKVEINGKVAHLHAHVNAAPTWDLSKLTDEELANLEAITAKMITAPEAPRALPPTDVIDVEPEPDGN